MRSWTHSLPDLVIVLWYEHQQLQIEGAIFFEAHG